MQVWIFEVGPFLSLDPTKDRSSHRGITSYWMTLVMASPQYISAIVLLCWLYNQMQFWECLTGIHWQSWICFSQLPCKIKSHWFVSDLCWVDWVFLLPAGLGGNWAGGEEQWGELRSVLPSVRVGSESGVHRMAWKCMRRSTGAGLWALRLEGDTGSSMKSRRCMYCFVNWWKTNKCNYSCLPPSFCYFKKNSESQKSCKNSINSYVRFTWFPQRWHLITP